MPVLGDIVEAEWLDAGGWSGWHRHDDVMKNSLDLEDRMCRSVGYYVTETEHEVTIALSQTVPRTENDEAPRNWADVMIIPKSQLRELRTYQPLTTGTVADKSRKRAER